MSAASCYPALPPVAGAAAAHQDPAPLPAEAVQAIRDAQQGRPDAMDRWVVAYDKQGNSVTRSLDISGRVRAVTDPNGNSTTNTWYGASKNVRLKEAIDALGRKTTPARYGYLRAMIWAPLSCKDQS